RVERLNALASEIATAGPRPLVIEADLQEPLGAEKIAQALATAGVEPQYVVNNAGFGLLGAAAALDRTEQLAMIDLNVRALTDLSVRFVDSLERHHGGILNVASIAGFLPGPFMAVYYATKSYVISFSEALHAELARRGIRVTVLCPGPVATEFGERAGANIAPRLMAQPVEEVAEAGYRGLMAGRRMVVPGLLNKIVTLIAGKFPRAFVLAVIDRSQSRREARRRTGS
ncbi:MAG: SDR family NAD(P)-dependent oxidoreductase, partial [Pseudolabrys sp.]|nr:SDR family NAD(P)-dependent oxidoreductase [Pseudolabrys sp.]